MQNNAVAIIGAGPAGLTAAYLLAQKNLPVTVLEADPIYVGGIAKTVVYKGFCFDIGGHRFFSKSKEVEDLWSEMLANDMLERPRSSRIFYQKKFYTYPLNFLNTLSNLGFWESILCGFSYLKAKLFPIKDPVSFADWVSNHFGKRLFKIFFETYTEKVWGMPCQEISADWAAQRIKGLSLFSAVLNSILPKNPTKKTIKTLIHTFRYPRKGPGMLWEACANKIRDFGGEVLMGTPVTQCEYDAQTKTWQISYTENSITKVMTAKHVISSAPLRELATDFLQPVLSQKSITAAKSLKYRDFLIVVLILKDKDQFSDNWIYIHDPSVSVARIQNFKSWSPEMVPDPALCCYGMEYFCFEGDGLWDSEDNILIQKASDELIKLGLAEKADIVDGCVVRQPKAYPVYDKEYKQHVEIIRQELEKNFPTLHTIGRNGMHKYNNQDHAMMTAMLTVKNILAEKNIFNIWHVNQDAEYHESGHADEKMENGLRMVPESLGKNA